MRREMTEDAIWIRTDEAEDVAASVRHVMRCRVLAGEDPQAWKWMALALHAALQGALVCHLVTTASPLGVVTDRNAQEWADYFEKSRTDRECRPPETRLLDLPELIKLARKPRSAGDGRDALIRVSDAELVWLRRFHADIRNQFVHFEPMGWSVEVSGLASLAALISRIIEDTIQGGWAFRHKDVMWRDALRTELAALASRD
ncbi:hypothetical protein [Brevundimonas sp.]|uniref:hypothetical protein n=1 Tax=Brevundimonas sp. TaxID=1871086 RepID=UPI002D73FD5E|nr:hypothetical protein [Brevundimonas sp.]HYC99564.1 hypothetical protein [Brevundimonas sp.]